MGLEKGDCTVKYLVRLFTWHANHGEVKLHDEVFEFSVRKITFPLDQRYGYEDES